MERSSTVNPPQVWFFSQSLKKNLITHRLYAQGSRIHPQGQKLKTYKTFCDCPPPRETGGTKEKKTTRTLTSCLLEQGVTQENGGVVPLNKRLQCHVPNETKRNSPRYFTAGPLSLHPPAIKRQNFLGREWNQKKGGPHEAPLTAPDEQKEKKNKNSIQFHKPPTRWKGRSQKLSNAIKINGRVWKDR